MRASSFGMMRDGPAPGLVGAARDWRSGTTVLARHRWANAVNVSRLSSPGLVDVLNLRAARCSLSTGSMPLASRW